MNLLDLKEDDPTWDLDLKGNYCSSELDDWHYRIINKEVEQSSLGDKIKGSVWNSNYMKKAREYNIWNIINVATKMSRTVQTM